MKNMKVETNDISKVSKDKITIIILSLLTLLASVFLGSAPLIIIQIAICILGLFMALRFPLHFYKAVSVSHTASCAAGILELVIPNSWWMVGENLVWILLPLCIALNALTCMICVVQILMSHKLKGGNRAVDVAQEKQTKMAESDLDVDLESGNLVDGKYKAISTPKKAIIDTDLHAKEIMLSSIILGQDPTPFEVVIQEHKSRKGEKDRNDAENDNVEGHASQYDYQTELSDDVSPYRDDASLRGRREKNDRSPSRKSDSSSLLSYNTNAIRRERLRLKMESHIIAHQKHYQNEEGEDNKENIGTELPPVSLLTHQNEQDLLMQVIEKDLAISPRRSCASNNYQRHANVSIDLPESVHSPKGFNWERNSLADIEKKRKDSLSHPQKNISDNNIPHLNSYTPISNYSPSKSLFSERPFIYVREGQKLIKSYCDEQGDQGEIRRMEKTRQAIRSYSPTKTEGDMERMYLQMAAEAAFIPIQGDSIDLDLISNNSRGNNNYIAEFSVEASREEAECVQGKSARIFEESEPIADATSVIDEASGNEEMVSNPLQESVEYRSEEEVAQLNVEEDSLSVEEVAEISELPETLEPVMATEETPFEVNPNVEVTKLGEPIVTEEPYEENAVNEEAQPQEEQLDIINGVETDLVVEQLQQEEFVTLESKTQSIEEVLKVFDDKEEEEEQTIKFDNILEFDDVDPNPYICPLSPNDLTHVANKYEFYHQEDEQESDTPLPQSKLVLQETQQPSLGWTLADYDNYMLNSRLQKETSVTENEAVDEKELTKEKEQEVNESELETALHQTELSQSAEKNPLEATPVAFDVEGINFITSFDEQKKNLSDKEESADTEQAISSAHLDQERAECLIISQDNVNEGLSDYNERVTGDEECPIKMQSEAVGEKNTVSVPVVLSVLEVFNVSPKHDIDNMSNASSSSSQGRVDKPLSKEELEIVKKKFEISSQKFREQAEQHKAYVSLLRCSSNNQPINNNIVQPQSGISFDDLTVSRRVERR